MSTVTEYPTVPMLSTRKTIVNCCPAADSGLTSLKPTVVMVMKVMYRLSLMDHPSINV